jgi:hypothetical protein
MRYRRNSDEFIRDLERRVLAGDLSEVPSLARAYERVGKNTGDGVLLSEMERLALKMLLANLAEHQGEDVIGLFGLHGLFWELGDNGVSVLVRKIENGEDDKRPLVERRLAAAERAFADFSHGSQRFDGDPVAGVGKWETGGPDMLQRAVFWQSSDQRDIFVVVFRVGTDDVTLAEIA